MRIKTGLSQLSPDEERQLLADAQQGDLAARDQLILANLPFAYMYAYKYYVICHRPRWVETDDLEQECVIGMLHAIKKWNPSKNRGRWVNYAKLWMRSYMQKFLRYGQLWKVPPSTAYYAQYTQPGQMKASGQPCLSEEARAAALAWTPMELCQDIPTLEQKGSLIQYF